MSAEPIYLANKVIKMMTEHLFADLPELQYSDYMAIRAVFRRIGGSWVAVGQGDTRHFDALQRIVIAWSQMPGREAKEKVV